jgi:nitrite reductase/ring-hydroxylating ferredoxin subunit
MAGERQRIPIGKSGNFKIGEMNAVEVEGRELGITRLRDGALRAVLNRCPHKGAPICRGFIAGVWDSTSPGELLLDESRSVLVCPWHGFAYDLHTGNEVCWKRTSRLRLYPIEEVNGEVFVSM